MRLDSLMVHTDMRMYLRQYRREDVGSIGSVGRDTWEGTEANQLKTERGG